MIMEYITLASLYVSTTYGYGEMYCGDESNPATCDSGATTASGLPFNPDMPYVAVPAPVGLRIVPQTIFFWSGKYQSCIPLQVVDKKNQRFVGKGGFDFTPGALKKLGIVPKRYWSGRVNVC